MPRHLSAMIAHDARRPTPLASRKCEANSAADRAELERALVGRSHRFTASCSGGSTIAVADNQQIVSRIIIVHSDNSLDPSKIDRDINAAMPMSGWCRRGWVAGRAIILRAATFA